MASASVPSMDEPELINEQLQETKSLTKNMTDDQMNLDSNVLHLNEISSLCACVL
jgi:hypothetical protein